MKLRATERRPAAPLVTVIATCFNHERFAIECLESIRAQTYPNVELIVADDCSTDASARLITDWVRETGTACTLLLHDQNQGICRTRNEALAHAHGAYVAGISTDDTWLPEKLAVQVDQLERLPPSVGVVYADAARMDDRGRPLPKTFIENIGGFERMPEGDLYETLLDRNFIPAGASLVRRECFESVGPYDESLIYEDWDMWLRIARRYRFAFTPHICSSYRVHEESLSHRLATHAGGRLWWEADLSIFLKHLGHSPAWDSVLWDRIARAAYRLDRPERLQYARANLRAGRSLPALALYVLCRAGVSYGRVAALKRRVRAVFSRLRPPRYERSSGSPTETSL